MSGLFGGLDNGQSTGDMLHFSKDSKLKTLLRTAKSIDLKSGKHFNAFESTDQPAAYNASPNDADLDEIIEDRLNDLIGTSYEDRCWSLPSVVAWHEWLINLPNLCILVVSS